MTDDKNKNSPMKTVQRDSLFLKRTPPRNKVEGLPPHIANSQSSYQPTRKGIIGLVGDLLAMWTAKDGHIKYADSGFSCSEPRAIIYMAKWTGDSPILLARSGTALPCSGFRVSFQNRGNRLRADSMPQVGTKKPRPKGWKHMYETDFGITDGMIMP